MRCSISRQLTNPFLILPAPLQCSCQAAIHWRARPCHACGGVLNLSPASHSQAASCCLTAASAHRFHPHDAHCAVMQLPGSAVPFCTATCTTQACVRMLLAALHLASCPDPQHANRYHYNVSSQRLDTHINYGSTDSLSISSVATYNNLWAIVMDCDPAVANQRYLLATSLVQLLFKSLWS